jgi:hypothetical protein
MIVGIKHERIHGDRPSGHSIRPLIGPSIKPPAGSSIGGVLLSSKQLLDQGGPGGISREGRSEFKNDFKQIGGK